MSDAFTQRLAALEARVTAIETALPDRISAVLIARQATNEIEQFRALKGLGRRLGLALLIAAGSTTIAICLNVWLT